MGTHRHVFACLALACLAAAAPAVAQAAPRTTWLCKPGLAKNPCETNLGTDVKRPDGTTSSNDLSQGGRLPVDCFYVYPTVSGQQTLNADRRIDPELQSVAQLQASRFSRVCNLWAPVYRQVTLRGLSSGGFTKEGLSIGYRDVAAAWRDYLRNHNRGRGVVLIGHSQGTGMLTRLVKEQLDRRPAQRRRLVSALLMGGGVTVRKGGDRGGDFKRVRACRAPGQTGCVIAYNSYLTPPLEGGIFGRVNNLYVDQAEPRSLEVLCTNPAALGGGTGGLLPQFQEGTGRWSSYPDLYDARCRRANGASWLQVTDVAAPGDGRRRLTEVQGPAWGLHLFDVNLALGNLVNVVGRQARSFASRRR